MQRHIFFLIVCWIFLSSFFWSSDVEKQLRLLHQSAETALKNEDYNSAKSHYADLIERIGVNSTQKYSVDWPTYVDIVLRYAEACEKLAHLEEGERALSRLLRQNPPEEQIPRIKLMRIRLGSPQQSPGEAYLELADMVKIYPKEQWRKEEISFFRALEYSLNTHYDQLVSKAKRYLVTGYYNEAITLYEEILRAIESKYYPKASLENSLIQKKIRYRLAECHYSQANYEQSLALCYNGQVVEDRIDREMLYLSALCYREKREYEKGIALLQKYTSLAKREDLDHYDHALFEMGHFYYEVGNREMAYKYFEQLQQFEGKPRTIAALYLARMASQGGDYNRVERLLTPLAKKLASTDLLHYECCYLQGEAAYALGDYSRAKDLFERSLPPQKSEWTERALFQLGWSYMRLGEEQMNPVYFSKAEEIFTKLFKSDEQEAAALALGRLNTLRWIHFHDTEALLLAREILLPYDSLEAFLIRAQGGESYEERARLLREATDERFQLSSSYADAWYERGLNYFQEGLKDPGRGGRYFELAAAAFSQSFRSLDNSYTSKGAQIRKLEAKADAYRNSPLSSLALLTELLSQFNESVEEREETLYLRGLIASRLEDHFDLAEESLLAVAHGKGRYRDEALYVLGSLYYGKASYENAIETFTLLAAGSPTSPMASESWFWAAESAEKLEKRDLATALRINVYQLYPDAPKAAEAYFRRYTYASYLGGEEAALGHLRLFPRHFPESPLLVAVHYLIGLNEGAFERAKEAFEEAIKSFSLSPHPSFVYFRYQACLKLAQLHLSREEDLDTALHLLHSLVNDFSTQGHPLASQLMQTTPYPSVYEEGEYTLVQAYLQSGKRLRAQERLSKMLKHYEEAGIGEGLYLAQVWREQGKLADQSRDYDTALECYKIAAEVGSGYLDEEQKLSIWLLESHAYRGKKEYGTAMRLLSKVINTDVASPLRLKAMFHRAELYELQGRPELAIRQLEAMAKKGGEWALQAQEKLRHEYGL